MRYIFFFIFFSGLISFSCNESPSNGSEKPSSKQANTSAVDGEKLPSITMEKMKTIWEKCDYIDFVFYKTNFSMSMDQKGSIQGAVRHIAQETPTLNPACKSIGRIFFEIEGETFAEAEIFFQEGCKYFVFYENKKKAYANYMSEEGITHYTNLFKQFPQNGSQQ